MNLAVHVNITSAYHLRKENSITSSSSWGCLCSQYNRAAREKRNNVSLRHTEDDT